MSSIIVTVKVPGNITSGKETSEFFRQTLTLTDEKMAKPIVSATDWAYGSFGGPTRAERFVLRTTAVELGG